MANSAGKLEYVDKKVEELYGHADLFIKHTNELMTTIYNIANSVRDQQTSEQIRRIGNTIFDTMKHIPEKYIDYANKLSSYVHETRHNIYIAFDQLDDLDREIDDCISQLTSQ